MATGTSSDGGVPMPWGDGLSYRIEKGAHTGLCIACSNASQHALSSLSRPLFTPFVAFLMRVASRARSNEPLNNCLLMIN